MASPSEFARRIDRLALRIEGNVDQTVRRVAIAVDQAVVLATPVDTGRARSNWIAQVGSPARRTVEPTSAQATISQAQAEIGRREIGQDVYISNNLPYIERLNEGSSAQAPAGFVEEAARVGVREAQRARVVPRGGR